MPSDENTPDKELKKINKYLSLKIELEQLWKIKIMVIPVVTGALGTRADRSPGCLPQMLGTIRKVKLQKSAILGTSRALVEPRV